MLTFKFHKDALENNTSLFWTKNFYYFRKIAKVPTPFLSVKSNLLYFKAKFNRYEYLNSSVVLLKLLNISFLQLPNVSKSKLTTVPFLRPVCWWGSLKKSRCTQSSQNNIRLQTHLGTHRTKGRVEGGCILHTWIKNILFMDTSGSVSTQTEQ